jgi:hypothetical protein
MKKEDSFKALLKKAAKSARTKAARKKLPVAVSENGQVVLIYPDKSRKPVNSVRKKAS